VRQTRAVLALPDWCWALGWGADCRERDQEQRIPLGFSSPSCVAACRTHPGRDPPQPPAEPEPEAARRQSDLLVADWQSCAPRRDADACRNEN
jgi:hypothetical protein